jgi:hypothetical protein
MLRAVAIGATLTVDATVAELATDGTGDCGAGATSGDASDDDEKLVVARPDGIDGAITLRAVLRSVQHNTNTHSNTCARLAVMKRLLQTRSVPVRSRAARQRARDA